LENPTKTYFVKPSLQPWAYLTFRIADGGSRAMIIQKNTKTINHLGLTFYLSHLSIKNKSQPTPMHYNTHRQQDKCD